MADPTDNYTQDQAFQMMKHIGVLLLAGLLGNGMPHKHIEAIMADYCYYVSKGIPCSGVQLSVEIFNDFARMNEETMMEMEAEKATKQ